MNGGYKYGRERLLLIFQQSLFVVTDRINLG
ncbi:MAG: hypothetical protein MAG581_01698 [Deltaproteobacteria bacterium]|nr:hypothetical protein [Deltaproteobacteria bacterium]